MEAGRHVIWRRVRQLVDELKGIDPTERPESFVDSFIKLGLMLDVYREMSIPKENLSELVAKLKELVPDSPEG
tara:strand:- start:117 stop:335 length:219 start_codon:yes stop_codon:yes gene_type:complete